MDDEREINDVQPPREIALQVERIGVAKARTETATMLVLSVLAGAYISLGALFFTVVVTDSTLGLGATRLLGRLSLSLGLILVVVAGAELFTGNNLIAMAWASGSISTREVVRNWVLVYIGNVVGCLGTVLLVVWSDVESLGGGAVRQMAIDIAATKAGLSLSMAGTRGILCNALVCLAVWLAIGARNATDKILVILFPVTAFVTIGLERSIANWFFLPWGLALGGQGALSFVEVARNIAAVTAGNLVGGTLLVAGMYWVAYLRAERVRDDRFR